jgi:hypothetical protein
LNQFDLPQCRLVVASSGTPCLLTRIKFEIATHTLWLTVLLGSDNAEAQNVSDDMSRSHVLKLAGMSEGRPFVWPQL